MTKGERIKQSISETRQKRHNQILKVYSLKVNCHHTSKEDYKKLSEWFREAKWIINDMIASPDIFKYNYKDHRTVKNFDKDHNLVERNITLPAAIYQEIVKRVKENIVNLSKAKKKGMKVGALKFKREINRIPLRNDCIRVISSKQLSIAGFHHLSVYGLEQFINVPEHDVANANLVRKASGIYIKITVFLPKNNIKRVQTNKTVGLDFGIKDTIVTSDGDKYSCNKQETEYMRFLSRKLSRKIKGSRRYYRCLNQLKREYEHLSNQKDDYANKLFADLKKKYDVIFIQDEQLKNWQKGLFGRQVQGSILGRMKSKVTGLAKDTHNQRAYVISKWLPTTKMCPVCGAINKIGLAERTYHCACGYSCDRDIHAARNVKMFGSTKRAECLEQTSVEGLTAVIGDAS